MDLNKNNVKKILFIIFSCILFYLAIRNIGVVVDYLGAFLNIIFPFILGGAIAFIINVPMTRLEHLMFKRTEKMQKARRPISILVTLFIVIGIIIVAMYIIIPQIGQTLVTVAKQLPDAISSLQDWFTAKTSYWESLQNLAEQLSINWEDMAKDIANTIKDFASNMVGVGFGAVVDIASALLNFVIGFIFALYILFKKEKLGRQGKQVIYALTKEPTANKILYILTLANHTFSRFISGQCLEACILGLMFFVTMSIIGLPYAMLISVMIAFTALIPMVGAFLGCVFGALLILIESPTDAVIFVIMFLILQQIEGNLVYPHVVGGSIGLPSIWVLVAITVGGNLMGVVGMIIFIPICSVLYSLFRLYIKDRLHDRNIPDEKWMNPVHIDESVMTNNTHGWGRDK